ncbi:MAG: 4Fe-4S dicluster domain-containing protein [Bacteroidales bacterium OttesenSCG-928-I14]|jgi:ferredoxin|nr:4Fe-4S dicluster domain-containing protein [Bacteroidales bacterium OttesenSCG-928-I14]
MNKMNEIAIKLLKTKEVQIIIGYTNGSMERIRPFFAKTEKECEKLIFNKFCTQNLAIYLIKKEVLLFSRKQAIVSNVHTLRGIIRLASEKQLSEDNLIIITANEKQLFEFRTFEQIENYLSNQVLYLNKSDEVLFGKLNSMNLHDRWTFWENEMKNCIRCYACRQVCPLCYCSQCVVELNQPQWIPVTANILGNTEWHIMRAMHLAGRCIECGECGRACPKNIPVHLLSIRLAEEIKNLYGSITGLNKDEICEMAVYKSDDKENFFK